MLDWDDASFRLVSLICWGAVGLLTLLLTLSHLSAQGRALAKCGRRRRTMAAGLVWLNLVPLFHLFWKFWTAAQVGASLRNEFDARGLKTTFTFGRAVGALVPSVAVLTRCVFWGGGFVASQTGEDELAVLVLAVSLVLGVAELVLVIVHWAQLNWYTRRLIESRLAADDLPVTDDGGGPREFDDDYRPVSRHRRP